MSHSLFDSTTSNASVSQRLVANKVVCQTLVADTITNSLFQSVVPGKGILYQAIIHAPNTTIVPPGMQFANATVSPAAGSTLYFNSVAGVSQGTGATLGLTTNQWTYVLPAGAQLVSARATNNGTTIVGGTTFNIGAVVYAAVPLPAVANIFAAVPTTSLNLGMGTMVQAGGGVAGDTAALPSVGTTWAPAAPAAANTVIAVTNLGPAVNTAGDLALLITYLL